MARPTLKKPRGILYPWPAHNKFQLELHDPSSELESFVEHYWIVRWSLPVSEPYVQQTLPHPSVHLVVEQGCSRIVGVKTGKFRQLLRGSGWVFGVKWKPGAFYPFVRSPVVSFTDRERSLMRVFGADGQQLEARILAAADAAEMIAIAESFLLSTAPVPDDNLRLVSAAVEHVAADRTTTAVAAVARRFGVSTRTLQRLFNLYVGVSPKWVIRRYRLHDAADLIAAGEVVDWRTLARELGYVDQAHFIHEFKAVIGETPARYAMKR